MKQRAPALPDSPTFQQLWDTLGSKLIESAQEHLLYTQEVTGSSPVPPTKHNFSTHKNRDLLRISYYPIYNMNPWACGM